MNWRPLQTALLASLALAGAFAVCPTTEWVDPDTPASACGLKTDTNGDPLELVFSDEFNVPGRTFQDGEDPRWTAVTGFPQSNSQANAYVDSPMYARTANGKLRLRADASDNRMAYYENGIIADAKRPYATPMLQSWNKFCFTEGVLEMSAQLPGIATQGGLWPAFWVMGNLGRATAQKSTDRIWPFSYSHCPSAEEARANQFPAKQQEINACRPKEWTDRYGLNQGQGRGAIEIDIVEAMPGNFTFGYEKYKVVEGACKPLPADQYKLLESPRPMVATSLQLAPGIPFGSDQRPKEVNTKHGGSQAFNCIPEDWTTQWYPAMKQGSTSTYGKAYNSQPNVDFWGEYFKGVGADAIDLQTDSLSSLNTLPQDTYTGQHVYHLDWKAGPDGHVVFQLDGKMQFRVNASSALRERAVTIDKSPVGRMLGRQMPEEPSYIMLNIDLSTRWGWPDCRADLCDCCTDCRDPKCTTCYYPGDTTTNHRQWMADLCKTLPAYYEIDYVRLWQRKNNVRTSCSPKDYPTQGWIESHRERYILPNFNEPLRPVLAGGSLCTTDADCGGSQRGSCVDTMCSCSAEWTGPQCLVKRSGASLTCKPLEDAAVGGAHCFTDSKVACGLAKGHGRCVEASRPGGWATPNQTYAVDGAYQKVGGGDGRCLCSQGWVGTSCNVAVGDSKTCVPKDMPKPAWSGQDLEKHISGLCNRSYQTTQNEALVKACDEVMWKPYWQQGGEYAGCGAWLRAVWVAKAVQCEDPPADVMWVLWLSIGIASALMVLCICLILWRKSRNRVEKDLENADGATGAGSSRFWT
jgi:beta-glucanase (GH16 family)